MPFKRSGLRRDKMVFTKIVDISGVLPITYNGTIDFKYSKEK